jgi:hypothetical protein
VLSCHISDTTTGKNTDLHWGPTLGREKLLDDLSNDLILDVLGSTRHPAIYKAGSAYIEHQGIHIIQIPFREAIFPCGLALCCCCPREHSLCGLLWINMDSRRRFLASDARSFFPLISISRSCSLLLRPVCCISTTSTFTRGLVGRNGNK